MPPDLEPELGHVADAAGWALGVLNPADALAFQGHLPGCAECRQTVADFQRVARVLKRPSPEIELPPGLEERTITAVLQAAAAAAQPPARPRELRRREARTIVRWPLRDWRTRLLTAAAAAAVVAAAVVAPLSLGSAGAPRPAAEFSLNSLTSTVAAWGQATVYHEPTGFKIVFHLHELPPTEPGQNYGAWYIGPEGRGGRPSLITVGSFTVGRSGTANPTMWSSANPAKFRTMEITIDNATGTAPGKQILVGHAVL